MGVTHTTLILCATHNVLGYSMHTVPFPIENKQRYTTECPNCSHERSKKNTRSLSVYRDSDAMIRYRCHHPGCEWNAWQKVSDPYPQEFDTPPMSHEAIMPIPSHIEIPLEYFGDTLYWYRDKDGNALFANRRIQLSEDRKIYVPFIYTELGFITGKDAHWPPQFKGLYGAETLKDKTKVVIVEGEKAADAAKIRFPNSAVVTWLGGANRDISTVDWSVLNGIEKALLWPDNDEPGHAVMSAIARTIPVASILIANVRHLPKGHDLADTLSHEDFDKAVKTAHTVNTSIDGVWNLKDIEEQMAHIAPLRNTGYAVFDGNTPLPGSGLLIVEGRTKHGKSALAIALTSSMLVGNHSHSVVYYSYEMTASKVFLRYMKSLDPTVTLNTYKESKEAHRVCDWITQGKLKIIDQSAQKSIGDIVKSIKSPTVRGGVVVIDYLQIVPMSGGAMRSNRQLILKEMLDELRVAAHVNNVLIIILSQLTPDYKDPRNDSPREAKDIHYSADLVLRVWNKALSESNTRYDKIVGNFVVHTYLNRDGESNVAYECSLKDGSHLKIKRRVKD